MDTKSKNAYTKAAQFEILVEFMKEHSDLSKGKLNTANGKTTANNLWQRLSEDLNAAGPPARDIAGWKKVWADYKTHLKAKLRKNKRSISDTGGGPSQHCSLTMLEEAVVQLLSMEEAVQGTSGTQNFGVPEVCDVLQDLPLSIADANVEVCNNNLQRDKSTPYRSRSVPTLVGKDQLLKKQVENQIAYQEGSMGKLTQICDTLNDISKTLKKTKDIEESKLRLAKRKFEHEKETDLKKTTAEKTEAGIKKRNAKLGIKSTCLILT